MKRRWFATFILTVTACSLASTNAMAVECEGRYPHHLQGVCLDGNQAIYWSFTTVLVKTDRSGKLLKKIPVANHHGDLCHLNGKIYVAVNLGKFNDPKGNANSWVYVYDAETLQELTKYPVPEVFYGAGGIGYRNQRFYVVGGLPQGLTKNFVYEYDMEFRFLKKHEISSGHTLMGIQTATFADNQWWFGCYGDSKTLLVTDSEFQSPKRFPFDSSLGIESFREGQLITASGSCQKESGCSGRIQIAVPDEKKGLRVISESLKFK